MESETNLLREYLTTELSSVRLDYWGYIYPVQIAVWRFIQAMRPRVLGPLDAGFDEEQNYKGKGAKWFANGLGNQEDYLDALEAIMYPLIDAIPKETLQKERISEQELPEIPEPALRRLAEVALKSADEAVRKGAV